MVKVTIITIITIISIINSLIVFALLRVASKADDEAEEYFINRNEE